MYLRLVLTLVALSAWLSADAQDTEIRSQPDTFHRATGNAPPPGTIFLYPERIPGKDDQFINVERGFVFVPLNRSKPGGDVIAIEVYRFKAEGGESNLPPVFQLYGGPGFPGLGDRLNSPRFFEQTVWPITRTIGADLVVVGQRGIGSSKPDTLISPIKSFPPHEQVTAEQYAKAVRVACEKGKSFWKAQGLDLSGFTVIEAAADVNDLRKALGYEKIIISGGSFGSHWGMAVMRFHPQIVERAVLSSLEGPDHTWDMPSYVLNSLKRMAAAADQNPELAEQIPEGGLMAALTTVIERLEKKPVVVNAKHPSTGKPASVRLDARVVRSLALGYTATVRSRRGMPSWPADVLKLYDGDYQKAAQEVLRGDERNLTASYFLLDCASGISRRRKVQLDADPAVAVLGQINALYRASIPVWDIDLGDDFRQNFNTEIPTLLVHGTWDVSTPLENAQELAPYFKKGKLVLVKGGSHDALREANNSSRSFRSAYFKFLQTGDLSVLPNVVNLPAIRWIIPD